MKRQPTSHAHFTLPEAHFEEVVSMASAWTRGVPPFQKYRGNRRRAGVPEDLDHDELRDETWIEEGALLLRSFGDDEIWAVQFRHPQRNRPGVVWETVVLVDRSEGETEFLQLTTRSSKRGSYTASRAALVTTLVERFGTHLHSQLLAGEPDILWQPGAVSRYVRTVLAAPDRDVPIVVVSRRNGSGPTAVEAAELARCMVGSALVVELANAKVAFAWSNTLESLGFDPRLGCFHGAVRQYLPDLPRYANQRRGGHRLFRYDRLMDIAPAHRVETVAGAFLHDAVGPKVSDILDRVDTLLDDEE